MARRRKIWNILTCLSALALPLAIMPAEAADYTDGIDIPPRLQWNSNFGYCGEVSFIEAGLFYGQYVSQYEARAIASPGKSQANANAQLLLGGNDTAAAARMRLTYTKPPVAARTSAHAFLAWTKGNVMTGTPVTIGVFTNEYKFYNKSNPNQGDPDYDHIVTVTGFTSPHPPATPAAYYGDDRISFEDHGLWTGTPDEAPPYIFTYALGGFQKTRQEANAPAASIYSLKNGGNYGIAITGVIDTDKMALPVRLTTSQNFEKPAIPNHSTIRPAASPLALTVTVSGLKPGVIYNLYRYDTVANIPTGSFNANAAKASEMWPIRISSGSSYVKTITIESNETAAFRAVPASAP